MLLSSPLRRVFALALCLATSVPLAHAASSFRIDQLLSSLDGTYLYVVLRESAGHDGEQAIAALLAKGWVAEGTGPGVAFCGQFNDWDYWF